MCVTNGLKYANLGAKKVGIKGLISKKILAQRNLEKKILKISNLLWVTKGLKYASLCVKNVGIKWLLFKNFWRPKNLEKEFKNS